MKRWTPILAVVLILAFSGLALACPMCKDSIPNSDATAATSLPGGFNISVYTLLGGFFGVLGMIVTTLVKGIRGS